MKRHLFIILLLIATVLTASAQDRSRIDQYLAKGETWLSDRLQMHWQTHATQQYMRGEYYSHCGGDSAAVPTLQINGARSHATSYRRPSLDELQPRQEDSRGMYLQNKSLPGEPYEWAPLSRTGNIVASINREICSLALDAARLWQQTGDLRYARAAFSVVDTYMMGVLHTEIPFDLEHGHIQTLFGLQTHEVIHEETLPPLTQTYAILRDSLAHGSRFAIPEAKCADIEAAFKHWADIIETNGVPHNNWDLMQARFIFNVGQILHPDSAYADGKGQEHYFTIVETGRSIRQWSLKALTDYGYDPENGIWCECPGYSQVVLGDLAEFVRLYREQLDRDLLVQLPIIGLAARNNVEYLYPDSMTIGFGDTHPSRLNPDIYRKLGIDLSTLHPSRTFAAPRTSWLIQRNGMDRLRSLAFAINGSQGNHMHANGPSLELYGRGLRLGPDAGIGYTLYGGDDYKEWYSQFPAHNTVCVDGISTYAVMMSSHPIRILRNDEQPVAPGVTAQVSEVYFFEPESRSDQQRLVLLVTTGAETGYFVDVFRSRRQDGQDKMHDYFYHNVGQIMHTYEGSTGTLLPLSPTQELAFAGGHLYAYSYMYDKMSIDTDHDVRVTYTVHPDEQYMTPLARQLWADGDVTMTQWTKGEPDRTIFQCLAPTTEGLSRIKDMPYNLREQPTLTFVARQQGEAWTRPFVSVFEPSSQAKPGTVSRVTFPEATILDHATTSASAILVEHIDGSRQLIVTTDHADSRVRVLGTTYTGSLNIVSLNR
jgi:hypothetical protein